MITAGQIYRSCDESGRHPIRVVRYRLGEARAQIVNAQTGKRFRSILVTYLHASPTTRAGEPRRSGYVLEGPPDRWAWCFSHGLQHRFAADQDPWCTATWVWLDGVTEAAALTTKAQVYSDARFLHELPDYQQLAIINGDVPGSTTPEEPTQ